MAIKVQVSVEKFQAALKQYAEKMGKEMGDVVKEEARFVAQKLRDFTPPKTQAQGQTRVAADIRRVYQSNEWFTEKFKIKSKGFKEAIEKQDTQALQSIFNRSSKLRRLQVESFSENVHANSRDGRGRVRLREPISFPVSDQPQVEALIAEKKKAVGFVKGAWGKCVSQLGGKTPSWLNRSKGAVVDNSADKVSPSVTLINSAPYASDLLSRVNAVPRALSGRAKAMIKKVEKSLEAAKKFARFD